MSRYLVTGAGGMLAADLAVALESRDVRLLTRTDLDITDRDAVGAAVAPGDVIINTAAFTDVDGAEAMEDSARRVNAGGVRNLAQAAAEVGATLVHFSTDYVFDGKGTGPYSEGAPLAPVSAYGRTKAEGEAIVRDLHPSGTIVVRTAWLYGRNGRSFPQTMLRLADERETIPVVTDQVGQPTWTADLARQTVRLLDSNGPPGTYHGTNSGEATWYEFAKAIFELAGLDPIRITPTTSAEFVRPAPRPAYSVLGHDAWRRVGLEPMRHWREALSEAFATGALGAG